MSSGFIVTARRTDQIRATAHSMLDNLGVTSYAVPILNLIETLLPIVDEDFSFEVRDREYIQRQYGHDAEGITDHRSNLIILRSDVYEGAANGNGRDRFTAAHELGHYLLHKEEGLAFMRAVETSTPIYRTSEWQADTFARELLMDLRKVDPDEPVFELASLFGVSYTVAGIQLKQAKKLALGKGLIR